MYQICFTTNATIGCTVLFSDLCCVYGCCVDKFSDMKWCVRRDRARVTRICGEKVERVLPSCGLLAFGTLCAIFKYLKSIFSYLKAT